MQLWEVKGFQSSAVKVLFVGKTANGQDCIGCAWDAYTTYIFAYEGIIDTFMYYLETFKSVGQAMSATKLRNGLQDETYFRPYWSTMPSKVHNQLYRFERYEMIRHYPNIVVHQNLFFDTPENAIKNLISSGDLEAERSHLVDCMTRRVG